MVERLDPEYKKHVERKKQTHLSERRVAEF